ncbi:MAG: hypothetical protein MPJ50_12080 [Pirellulales bacterium]|nr:hypothetical protein [Pirellulales bacterium]
MASPPSSRASRARDFQRLLAELMRGKPIRLDDTSRPPWFEAGVVCEVSQEIYSHSLALPLWTNGSAFACGGDGSPVRLFWRSRSTCFGRELTPAEARRFVQLSQSNGCSDRPSQYERHGAGRIRLACVHCDTDAWDGIDRIPADWTDVDEFQSYEQSLEEVTPEVTTRSPTEWYTHLGVCPECQVTHGR